MKHHKPRRLILLSLILLVIAGITLGSMSIRASSILRLSSNPQGDATACLHHPAPATCTPQVSPFGTGLPGASSCAAQASIPALIAISDPTMNEAPIATLEVWSSPTCQAAFARASTSTLLGLDGPFTLTVSIARSSGWWQNTFMETRVKTRGGEQIVRAWTPLLLNEASAAENFQACLGVTALSKSYHVCTTH